MGNFSEYNTPGLQPLFSWHSKSEMESWEADFEKDCYSNIKKFYIYAVIIIMTTNQSTNLYGGRDHILRLFFENIILVFYPILWLY